MMYPPNVRLGVPPDTHHHVVMLHSAWGWILPFRDRNGCWAFRRGDIVTTIDFEQIMCWMPQDGS